MAALTLRSIRFCTLVLGVALGLAPPALAGDVSVKIDAGTGFSIKNSTGTVERLRVDEATGNISRNGALFVHTTGSDNLFIGRQAGNLGTTGPYNTGIGDFTLVSNTSGDRNTAVGYFALFNNTTGHTNAAFGLAALVGNTSGYGNSAFGAYAMTAGTGTGSQNSAFGRSALRFNNGTANSGFGADALRSNSSGFYNSAFGADALRTTSAGRRNSAFGRGALRLNFSGSYNAAFGEAALETNTTGSFNTALGRAALYSNTTGQQNTAVGQYALFNVTTGQNNVAVGWSAGRYQLTGNNNIYIQNPGSAQESGVIRIGTSGIHTTAIIAGIHGITTGGGIPVLVGSAGKLGTTTSSARFKQDVRDMGDASDLLMRLRPVTFRYTEQAVGAEESKATQYGLIAEEVEKVAPELVAQDLEGKPYSVKYHELPALLLNEVQEQERANLEQQRTIEKQAGMIEAQRQEYEKQIAALTTRLARLEAHAR